MPRPSKTDQELGAIRDFWTEIRTLEAEYHGSVSIYVNTTPRPGTISFKMVFTPLMGNRENHMETDALEFVYPNAEQTTLAPFLWRKAISLSRMVHQRQEMWGSAPGKRG